MQLVKKIAVVMTLLVVVGGFVGCKEKGSAEKAGQKVDETMEKAGEKMDETMEKAAEKAKELTDK